MKIRTKICIIGLPVLLLGSLVFGLLYLRTDRFQEFTRAVLVSRIEKATGLGCRMEGLRFDIFRGRFVITGLTLAPKIAAPGLATLKVHEIRSALSISSFWHFRVRLADLDIVRPQVELISGGGKSNWNPQEPLKTLKASLRLEAARVRVQDGWLKVNSRTTPFHLSLDDLDCEIRYSKKLPSYKIHLEYKRSQVYWEKRDIEHDLELDADLSLKGLEVGQFQFRRGASLFSGSGSVKDWNSPVLLIHTTGILDARDLILAHHSLYEGKGNIDVLTDLRYDRDGIYSKGKFSARTGAYRKMAFHHLAGNYEIQHHVLYLRDVTGGIAKGSFLVNGDIQLRNANQAPNRVAIVTKEVPLIEAGRFLNLPLINFENTADTTTVLTWHGGQALTAECDADLNGMAHPETKSGKSMLLAGRVQFTYSEGGAVVISSANLSSPYTTMQASGGQGALFHIQLSTNRISEPLNLVAGFSPPVAGLLARQPDLPQMAGVYNFNGEVRIQSSSDVEYRGGLSIKNGHWRSYNVDTLSAQVHFNSPRVALQSLAIHSGPQKVEGNLDLELAEREQVSSLRFRGNIDQVSLASLKDLGTDTGEITGIVSGSGSIQYGQNAWEGGGQFAVESGSFEGKPFDSLRAQVQLENQRLHLVRAEARRGAARLSAEGQVDLATKQLNMTVWLHGFSLQEIPVLQEKHLPVEGRVSASGTLRGTTRNPALAGTFEMDLLRYDRWNLGQGKGRIELEDGTVQGNAAIESGFGRLAIQATISTGSGYPGKAVLEFEDLDIQKIVPAKTPPYLKELSTALKGKVEIEGKFDSLSALKMRGEMDGAHFKIQEYELHNAGRIQFAVLGGNLRVENVRFVGEGTSLVLSGAIPLNDSPKMDMNLNGSLNLQVLEGLERKLHAAGSVDLNIRATGSMQNPQVIGRASFQDARLDYAEIPFRFSAMQGDIVFSRNLIRLENVRGAAASGTFQLSGAMEHQNSVIRSINLGISVRNGRLPYPKDFRSVVNAELVLSGTGEAQILGGEVNVIRMEYIRSFNLLEQLASRSAVQSGPLTTESYLQGLRFNVEIHSDNGLYIDNELARLRGSMRLTLRGTPGYPSLTGRVESSDGTIFFRGNRFEISRAAANFVDRNRIVPVLEIRAEADVKTYRLILDAIGDLDHLNLNVTSDPQMSTVDILSLLTTGKTDTATVASQHESQMAGMSAASVLSENLTGVIGRRVQRIFGLESFRVDPFLAGAENDPTARITISERLSKDLVVTFSRNLTTNQEQIVVIEYDVGRNLSIVGTRDENGKFGLDFRFRKRLR